MARSSSRPLEPAEGALDLLELLVGAHDVGRFELRAGDAGAQDVDAVERGLGGDLLLLAVEEQQRRLWGLPCHEVRSGGEVERRRTPARAVAPETPFWGGKLPVIACKR